MAHGYTANKEEVLSRLRKIEGQVRGVHRMIEQDAYCIDVLTQISAVVSGMEKVGMRLMSDHIRTCVRDAVRAEDTDTKIDELVRVVERFASG